MIPSNSYAVGALPFNLLGVNGISILPLKSYGYTLLYYQQLTGGDCDAMQALFGTLREQVYQRALMGIGMIAAPGFQFHTSQVLFTALPGTEDGVHIEHMSFNHAVNSASAEKDLSGNFTVTVSGGAVVDVVDNYNKIIDFDANDFGPFDPGQPAMSLYVTPTSYASPGIIYPNSHPAITDLSLEYFYHFFPTCAPTPPAEIPPPVFERLPKFSNFALPVNPFGIPR